MGRRRKHLDVFDHQGHILPLEEIMDAALKRAIEEHEGSFVGLARALNVGRSTLYRFSDQNGADAELLRTPRQKRARKGPGGTKGAAGKRPKE
jgi:DNA invertase Pin-like site-specific DNA recombinase